MVLKVTALKLVEDWWSAVRLMCHVFLASAKFTVRTRLRHLPNSINSTTVTGPFMYGVSECANTAIYSESICVVLAKWTWTSE